MSLINISNLTFAYDGSYDNIFDNVSFQIDTDWKLGFCGRNGRGKTTFLKLLAGSLEYKGNILCSVKFTYFPFDIKDKSKTIYEIAEEIEPNFELWQLSKELNLLEVSSDCLYRTFNSLSGGEQTKILLAILFLRNNNFLLIDEPTNHLDTETRQVVSRYLNAKKGFILVSHDRSFLDGCISHILSINKTNIEIQKGNFSSWIENKDRQDNFEIAQNEKLEKEIDRLKTAARQKTSWSFSAEAKKQGAADKGFMGAKAARQMKTAKIIERRQSKAIDDKTKLLRNLETAESIELKPLYHKDKILAEIRKLSLQYGKKEIFNNLNLTIKNGDRISITGKNGSRKSSLLKILLDKKMKYQGTISFAKGLQISYVPQDTSQLSGNLNEFIKDNEICETLFKSILTKLDFSRAQFEKDMRNYSAGQKKKVYLAKSLCENAHLYIWDEPLNYIDIISRVQIENLILEYQPTLLFVEHDKAFIENIATSILDISDKGGK